MTGNREQLRFFPHEGFIILPGRKLNLVLSDLLEILC